MKWIPVSERLPDGYDEVLVWCPFPSGGGCHCLATYWWTEQDDDKVWKDSDGARITDDYGPSHWTPIPSAPKD